MQAAVVPWLLESSEPWTRYRTRIDILDCEEDDPEARAARQEMIVDSQVQALMERTLTWSDSILKRHDDSKHPIYTLSTLADFGVRAGDPGMQAGVQAVLSHASQEGPFQSRINIPEAFGGSGEDAWSWMQCDAPTLLYTLLAMGLDGDPAVKRAVDHLVAVVEDNGWRCVASGDLGGVFRGPGRKADPCPIANVFALKALSLVPEQVESPAVHAGVEMLLTHWELRAEKKYYLFAMGTDFRKLKYPFIWYNILHVADVLSRFPSVHPDPRFQDMVAAITQQADEHGRYTASSMYLAWKGWSFADKKSPSPWLTFLVARILKRSGLKV